MSGKTYQKSMGRLTIETVMLPMGDDLCIVITGGSVPHLGAAAVAQVRKSLKDPDQLSSSVSVLTLPGHKEDEVTRAVAHNAAKALGTNVVVCCGIHVDNITEAELEFVDKYIQELCQLFLTPACSVNSGFERQHSGS